MVKTTKATDRTRKPLMSLSQTCRHDAQVLFYALVPYAFQMITIHHRATSGSLNSHCGLIETNRRFSFPPLSSSSSSSLGCPEAAPPCRWRPGPDAAWGWMVARQAQRGFLQGKGIRATCSVTPSFPKNTVFSCRADRVKINVSPLKKVSLLTCITLTHVQLVYA